MASAPTAVPPPRGGASALGGALAGVLSGWVVPGWRDPRWPFAALLTLYCVLGFLFFGFNRTPGQMLFIMGSGAALDVALTWYARRQKVVPLSAWITCASLAILLNYSKHSAVLFLPVLLAIGSKHVFTFEGKHVLNPSLFGVAVSLLVGGELITAAPAYQWAGSSLTVTFFLVTAALLLFVLKIGRGWLVVSFLVFYALNTGIRAWIMRHHLPAEMLFIGTMSTPPFYLFTLYMITDPATSPKKPAMQVFVAFCIAAVDLALHAKESVYTFFYAALVVGAVRYFALHAKKIWREGPLRYLQSELDARRLRGTFGVLAVAAAYFALMMLGRGELARDPGFRYQRIDARAAGIGSEMGDVLDRVDPRVHHIGKWLLSVGDAVAAGDVDNDGDVDLFFSNPMKRAEDRAALFLNEGGFRFTRHPLPALEERVHDPKRYGLPAGGTFVDWDGDGDLDLVVPFGFGKTRMLKSMLEETGALTFVDVSEEIGVDEHTVSLAVAFFDLENDGDLDMLILNATSPHLNDYEPPRPLNIFDLPAAEHAGDRRMLHFMHDGWHDANNGGGQIFYENTGDGRFKKRRGEELGLTSSRWSLAVSTFDANHDGYTDLYVANDFGPDELLLNEGGRRFRSVRGRMFNDIGNDTYKGMNATQADFDRNGFLDITVSNVHHALQAEGSMLWMVSPNPSDPFVPRFVDEATQRGALNERRFAWGAQAGDVDNDGWPDLVQANGMVDDRLDRAIPDGERKDYWYVNHKLMQSGPEIHTYADMWGDLRGRTIYPNEAPRAYLNLGDEAPGHFVDVAAAIGLAVPDNSRGVLLSDLDNDGDLDVVIANQHGPASLFQSLLRDTRAERAHFIAFDLRGGKANSRGVGAVVTISYEGEDGAPVTQLQEQHLLGGFASQHDPRLHFGLGAARGPVRVSVRWPGGKITQAQLAIDRLHLLREDETVQERCGG
jgi:enediyne biosynthesis protein E4